MKFIFDRLDATTLRQGDLLQKNEALSEAVAQAHPYYRDAKHYTHFMVVTQSCDLVRRGSKIGAPHITICAAKPLSHIVEKRLSSLAEKEYGEINLRVFKKTHRRSLEQYLERLLHNTEEGLFFIPADACELLGEDICVDLSLSIALRVEHYEAILQAKIAQLDGVFAAKVGWLKGNIYSRVATTDIEEQLGSGAKEYKKKFIGDILDDRAFWLSDSQLQMLAAHRRAKAGQDHEELTNEGVAAFLTTVPADIDQVVDAVVERLVSRQILTEDKRITTRNILMNDRKITSLIKALRAS